MTETPSGSVQVTESQQLLAPGIPFLLSNGAEVRLRFGTRALKVLEDSVGSIAEVAALLFPETPTDRVVRLASVAARGLKLKPEKILAALSRPIAEGGFGSLQIAAIELCPLDAHRSVGPVLKIAAASLLHEEALFEGTGLPRRDLAGRLDHLEDALADLVPPNRIGPLRQAVIEAWLEGMPGVDAGKVEAAPQTPQAASASRGEPSTETSPSTLAEATSSSGT